MPETAYDDVYQNGVLISHTPRTVSDAEILRRDAPSRLRIAYITLNAWAADARTAAAAEAVIRDGWGSATAGQKDAANLALHTRMAVTFDRLGTFFDRFADLLIAESLDQ